MQLPPASQRRAFLAFTRLAPHERRDERLSAGAHALAALAVLAAIPVLVVQAESWPALLAGGVFLAALLATFSSSAWLHFSRFETPLRNWLGLVDRCAIFVLIAGTYTPLAGLGLAPGWALISLATVWALALVGIAVNAYGFYRLRGFDRLEGVNIGLYLAQGWSGPVLLAPLFWTGLSAPALIGLAAGGLAYTVGIAFYCWPRLAYNHTIWHLFVVAGAGCHGWAIMAHAVPAG